MLTTVVGTQRWLYSWEALTVCNEANISLALTWQLQKSRTPGSVPSDDACTDIKKLFVFRQRNAVVIP